jgi:hypothetical protein
MGGDDIAADTADVQRRFEQVVHGGERLVVARRGEVAVDAVEDLLRGREVPGGLDDEQAVVAGLHDVQLAVRRDVVDAGVGARVGQEDEPLVETQGEAVGHSWLRWR